MAKGGFRGMPGGMNQAAMMKQAQKMQQEMLRMQQEMESKTYTAAAGGGMVKATVNGKHEVVDLVINPEAVDSTAVAENNAKMDALLDFGRAHSDIVKIKE